MIIWCWFGWMDGLDGAGVGAGAGLDGAGACAGLAAKLYTFADDHLMRG